MTTELVHGQNHPLPGTTLEVRVSAGTPVVAGVSLGDGQGRVSGPGSVAHPGAPRLPGIEVPARLAAEQRVIADLAAVPAEVDRVHVLLALPPVAGAPTRFGACPAPHLTVHGSDGAPVASFTVTGLSSEAAIVALELYRRQGAWKVRALGQGYAGGLAELLRDQGLGRPEADAVAARVADAVRPAPAVPSTAPPPVATPPPPPVPPTASPAGTVRPTPAPVAGDASGWSMEERLHNQVWGMFEDLARTIAAYRSAVDFAESRLGQELDTLLADPRARVGPAAEAARDQARARQAELVDRARAVLDRDLAQLTAEAEVVEPALPPPYAGWESPVWHGYRVPAEPPMAVRLGDLHLPERPELRIPLLVRLPLERGLWVDSAQDRRRAVDVAVALAARLLASHPAGSAPSTSSTPRAPPRRRWPRSRTPARCVSRPPRARPVWRRCSPGSPSGSTWCRWRCEQTCPSKCPRASTRPARCWSSTTSRTASTTGRSTSCATSPTRDRRSVSTWSWSPPVRTPASTVRSSTRCGAR